MEVRFKKSETRDLAILLSKTYHLRDGINDIVGEIEYATSLARVYPEGVKITIENELMFATLLYNKKDELVGVLELVGTIVKKGCSYVYRFE